MSNEQVKLVVDRKNNTMTITLPIEDRVSESEKSIIVAGITGSMKVMVGKEVHTLACSLYKKNPEYNEAEAQKRAEAKKTVTKTAFQAKLVA